VDLRNQGEHIVYATRKSLEEHGDKVSAETRSNIEAAISNLEDKLKGEDKSAIEAALKQLNDSAIELGKAVYEATAGQAPPPGAGPTDAPPPEGDSKPDDDVIDAEYEVKDDK
jgi:molecular chaperone DnaK